MLYTIENELLSVCVSDLGAELQSVRRRDTGEEYLWQGDPEVWSGRSPLLFPVVGRLKDDQYVLNGQTYDMPKHGFARKDVFKTVRESASRFTMSLTGEAHKDIYPFDFRLELTYEVKGERLVVTHRVANLGEDEMYFSLGAHPAFFCGMGDYLLFPEDETACAYRLTEEKLLTTQPVEPAVKNHRLTVWEDTFLDDALIFDGLRSDSVTLVCGGKPRVTVEYGSAPCLGVWAKPGAKYVCIEPWHGVDDSHEATGELAEKKHIVRLAQGCCFRFPMTVIPHI